MAFEQADAELEGMYTAPYEVGSLRGAMKDDTHLVLSQVGPDGAQGQGVAIEATMQGATLTGTWTAQGSSAPVSFSAGPLVLGTKETSLDEAFAGTLGTDIYIRAEIERSGTSLEGRYHYLGKSEDLRLEGTIQDDGGAFVLRESNAKGTPTGTFSGVLLDTTAAFGRWTSPRGSRSFLFFLRSGEGILRRPTEEELDAKAVSLPNGAKVAPRGAYDEPGPGCTSSVFYPRVSGMANAATQASLDGALKSLFNTFGADMKPDCSGDPASQSSFQVSYEVSAMANEAFAISTTAFQQSSQAAHPLRSLGCYVADLTKGTVTGTAAKLLPTAARAKVEAIARKGLEGAVGKELLGDRAAQSVVSDGTLLCVDHGQLIVQFNLYEVAPYAAGTPAIPIAHADAAPLVKGTVLEPFFR